MIPVNAHEHVPFDRWDRVVRFFPLPDMLGDGRNFAARFDEIGMVDSSQLAIETRASTLTERGILMLQQRWVFSDTRTELKMETLEEASAAVLAEAELLEDWNGSLVVANGLTGDDLERALGAQAALFDEFMSGVHEGGDTRRSVLKDQHRRPSVRRAVRDEIGRRAAHA
jgi:hypothetical protein